MKNEMDSLGMDERDRLAWLKANRVTLIFVGLVWIGMIARELSQGRTPLFLLAMVPVIALLRYGAFRYFTRAS